MTTAITEAEEAAQILLDSLSRGEVFSVTAQSFIDRWVSGQDGYHTDTEHMCFHVITIAYEG